LSLFRLLISIVVMAFLLSGCGRQPDLNLIIITIDTLRADHLSCYGYNKQTTPRIDAFAEGCSLFENVLCQSPQTLPSHASLFTGMHPRKHKAISHESLVGEGITTLAEILNDRAYRTGAFTSSHVLDSKYGLNQGFETYWEIHRVLSVERRMESHMMEEDLTTTQSLAWLRQNKDSRFFLWIHWFHPHRPYDPPPRYREAFAPEYDGHASPEAEFIMRVWREKIDLPEEDVDYLTGLYDGEIAFTDVQVGRILDELKALNLLGKTIVIITSDHGELLYEHEYYFGHDVALYDECLAIPLIIHAPTIGTPGRRVDTLVEGMDIFPTVLDLLEIRCPRDIEARSLLPLIAGTYQTAVEYAFSETFPFPEKCPPSHAARTADSKIIWREGAAGTLTKEFYDLINDREEMQNLYPGPSPAAARLDSALAAWIEPDGLRPAPIPSARQSGKWRILKSLGYVD
jgi:arylsulfatase A-like enzyme